VIALRTSERNGEQVGAVLVLPEDEIMLITVGGTLVRTTVGEIPVLGRSAQGVKLIRVGEGESLAGVERIVALDDDNPDEDRSDADDSGDEPAASPDSGPSGDPA
jgi:DNA gyrase subunit A